MTTAPSATTVSCALWAQVTGFSTGILEYGLVSVLFYLAFAPLVGMAPPLLTEQPSRFLHLRR